MRSFLRKKTRKTLFPHGTITNESKYSGLLLRPRIKFVSVSNRTGFALRNGRGLSLNRSQCGGCSTKYDTPSLKSSGLRAIPRLTLHGGFETRRRRQNPACRARQVGWPVRARRRVCNDDEPRHRKRQQNRHSPQPRPATATSDERPLWQAPAERKETPFVIPWRHRSRFRLRGFQPLSRGGSLAPPLVRASTRTVAPIPRFLSYWTG